MDKALSSILSNTNTHTKKIEEKNYIIIVGEKVLKKHSFIIKKISGKLRAFLPDKRR
jgi:hypothetical protein